MRCQKKFLKLHLTWLMNPPKIHRRCLPATGVRSSGLGSVRLPGFPAKEASWGSSSLHWHKELSSLVVFPPFSTGLECGSLAENKTCDNGDCPVDCALSEWGLFLSFHRKLHQNQKISIILIPIIKHHPHPRSSPFVQPLMDGWEANGVLVTAPVRQSQTSESVALDVFDWWIMTWIDDESMMTWFWAFLCHVSDRTHSVLGWKRDDRKTFPQHSGDYLSVVSARKIGMRLDMFTLLLKFMVLRKQAMNLAKHAPWIRRSSLNVVSRLRLF